MARDILSEYGPDSPSNQQARATSGGIMKAKERPYATPQGPLGQFESGSGHVEPGYGTKGENLGEGFKEFTGGPGIGGTNHGNIGSQGRH